MLNWFVVESVSLKIVWCKWYSAIELDKRHQPFSNANNSITRTDRQTHKIKKQKLSTLNLSSLIAHLLAKWSIMSQFGAMASGTKKPGWVFCAVIQTRGGSGSSFIAVMPFFPRRGSHIFVRNLDTEISPKPQTSCFLTH